MVGDLEIFPELLPTWATFLASSLFLLICVSFSFFSSMSSFMIKAKQLMAKYLILMKTLEFR